MNEEIIQPTRAERATCRSGCPVACAGVQEFNQIAEGTQGRQQVDDVRQAIDEIAGRCEIFNYYHQKHGRNQKLERLPCQIARRTIMVERLGGEWIEHEYSLPAGRK